MNTPLVWTVGGNSPRLTHAPKTSAEIWTCEFVAPNVPGEAKTFTASYYGAGQNMFRRWTLRDSRGAVLASGFGTAVNIRVRVGAGFHDFIGLTPGERYTFTGRIENPDGSVPDDVSPPIDFYVDFKNTKIKGEPPG